MARGGVKQRCPDTMLFAPDLVKLIYDTKGQELGSHTYSHYYCSLPVSRPEDFRKELVSSCEIFRANGYPTPRALVYPRNQVGDAYTEAIPKELDVYRGRELGLVMKIKDKNPRLGTLLWYADHYFPVRRYRSYDLGVCANKDKVNVRQCRLFKPYKEKYSILEPLKVRRYKRELLYAAKHNQIYHLCWHPHNFSENTEVNLKQLESIFEYYLKLNQKYGMQSMRMTEIADKIERV
jgi:peptidoglycan/xylan/chitin deacetylase (PgdA/CDA1 family)